MALNLELRQVQKKGGRIHLAVPGTTDADVRTLCSKLLAAGDYREVGDEADCQLCRKRRSDPALVSSAFFEGDRGSQLLEMSLAQARRSPRQARRKETASNRSTAESADRPDRRRRARPNVHVLPEATPAPEATPKQPASVGDLKLAHLQQVSENVYRSPRGVVIRTRKRGPRWEVAEIVFDGNAQVKRSREGGVRIKLGDVIAEYSAADVELRAHYRHEDTS
jgi:ribosomal protein L14